MAIAYQLLTESGLNSFIVPTSLFKEKHSRVLREFLINKTTILLLIDFGEETVFESIRSDQCSIGQCI